MSTTTSTAARRDDNVADGPGRRLTTETKSALKTTELIVYILAVVGVLVASLVTDQGNDGQSFDAQHAWLYVTLLTVGYMISRGLAKSGSREAYDA
jgi:hypothetical protein